MGVIKKVVMVGGGFANLRALYDLRDYSFRFETILIDKSEYAILKPKLTSIAVGEVVKNIKIFIPSILREYQAAWEEDEVIKIDTTNKKVITKANKELKYDYLFLGNGVDSDFLGFNKKNFYSFTTLKEALLLESEITSFTNGIINIVVLPHSLYEGSAIEAAFLIEARLTKLGVRKNCEINIITSNKNLYPQIGNISRAVIEKELFKRNINILTDKKIEAIEKDYIQTSNKKINSDLTIVLPSFKIVDFIKNSNLEINKDGVISNKFLKADSNIYIIGDINSISTPKLGHIAFEEAKIAVNNLLADENLDNKKAKEYNKDILSIIETGNKEAILIYSNINFGGKIDIAIKSIAAKELKIIFKNSLYFSLGEMSLKLDSTIKKLIKRYLK